MFESVPVFVMGSFVAACSVKVARLPLPGESLAASAFVLEAGGKGFNLAFGTRRLGIRVDGLLAIGNDLFAGLAVSALRRAGLNPDMLVHFEGATGAGVGFIDAAGENCLAVYPGANAKLSGQDVRQAAPRIQAAKLLLAQFEIGDEPIECAFGLARQSGATTLLNPSPYREIANTSILVVNRVEAGCLAAQYGLGAETAEAMTELAALLFSKGVEALVVTLGAEGALSWERQASLHCQPPFPVEAVDTLGAGDAFIAAFAAGVIDGHGLPECVRRGAAAGAHATTRLGVFDALPTSAELERRLATRPAREVTLGR
jgi:ribokinase